MVETLITLDKFDSEVWELNLDIVRKRCFDEAYERLVTPSAPDLGTMLNKGIWRLYTQAGIMADKIKKGALVRAIREKLENSVEAQASDPRFPPYLFETKGEVVDMKGDYALVKFGQVPTPNIWLRVDQLETMA